MASLHGCAALLTLWRLHSQDRTKSMSIEFPHAVMNDPRTTPSSHVAMPAGNPFRNSAFTVIWIVTVVSNIGDWMYNVASVWLMTSLDANALIVSMVQVANNSLPIFLFAIPAGALADIVNPRRFLIFGESAITIVSTAFAALVWLHLITPVTLLAFSFAVTIGSAMTAPAWQSVVGKLVSKQDLPGAVAASSVGINVSRAIGLRPRRHHRQVRSELRYPSGSMPLAILGSSQR